MNLSMQLAGISRQWQANVRLRIAVGLAGLLVGLWLLLVFRDWRDALAEGYRTRSEYMQRLRSLAAQPEWLRRAQAAERMRKGLDATIASAPSLGLAQAEVQSWARERAAALGGQVQIAGAPPAEVEAGGGLWRIPVTLSGAAAPQQVVQLMQTVETSPTLAVIQEASLLNRENRTFSMTVVFHYRIGARP
jgi:hypothetical protein